MSETLTINPGGITDTDWAAIRAFLEAMTEQGKKVNLSASDVLLSPGEVARRLGMSRTTVLRRIAAGDLAAISIGSHHRIPFPEYERFSRDLLSRMAQAIAPDIEAELFGE